MTTTEVDFIKIPLAAGRIAHIPRATAAQIRESMSPAGYANNVFWSASWVDKHVSERAVRDGVRAYIAQLGRRDAYDLFELPNGTGWLIVAAPERRKRSLSKHYRPARRNELDTAIRKAAAQGDTVRLHRLLDQREEIYAAMRGAAPLQIGQPGRPRKAAS